MKNPSLAPSLDSFLKVHGLVMASFDGKSTLRLCGSRVSTIGRWRALATHTATGVSL
jgi:hypothetical protein